jgi:hypothetical protein
VRRQITSRIIPAPAAASFPVYVTPPHQLSVFGTIFNPETASASELCREYYKLKAESAAFERLADEYASRVSHLERRLCHRLEEVHSLTARIYQQTTSLSETVQEVEAQQEDSLT